MPPAAPPRPRPPRAAAGAIEELAPVGAHVVLRDAGDERRRAPIADAIALQRRAATSPAASAAGGRLEVVHGAGDAGPKLAVLALRHAGNRDDALLQPVEVDLHGHRHARRARRLSGGLILGFSSGRSGCCSTAAAAPATASTSRRDASHTQVLVTLGKERAGLALLQHREIQPEGLLAIVRRHVEPLRAKPVGRRREEPQVLAVGVPRGEHRVGQSVGHLLCLAGLDVAHEDDSVQGIQAARIGHPLRVGTPHRIERPLRHHPGIAANDFGLSAGDVEHPHFEIGIAEQNLLRVGRPRRRVVVLRVGDGDLARRRQTLLRLEDQLVLTRLVAEVRHPLPVRRPRRLALRRAARVRQVADVALLAWNRKNLAARLDDDPLARGRERDVGDPAGHVLPARHHPRKIAAGGDLDRLAPAAFRIEAVDPPALLEDNRPATGVDRLDVEVGELRRLGELPGFGIERPDIRDAVTIGEEVDGVARPDRVHVLRVCPRRRDEIVSFEIDDPDRPVLAAAIIAPLLVPGVVHAIRDVCATRGDLPLVAPRQGQRLLDATHGGHGPESRGGIGRPARSAGGEEHRRAVGSPPLHGVRARVPRQALGIAAFCRHDVHVRVAGIFAAEGNRAAVW